MRSAQCIFRRELVPNSLLLPELPGATSVIQRPIPRPACDAGPLPRFCSESLAMLNVSSQRRIPLILHVEDDKAQAETLISILEGSGFLVLQAHTAEGALRLFKQEPSISLVLADHMLSGKSGTQLAAQIKKIKRTVPVVMHSGHPPATMSNIDGFIDKGEPPATLVGFIAELIRRFWPLCYAPSAPCYTFPANISA